MTEVRGLADYRWLSFDVVGTLIDFERGILDCVQQIASVEGVDVDDEQVLSSFAAAEDVGVNKPDPRVFAYCQGRQSVHGYRPEDWLHVAQSQYHDLATARRLGIDTCWVERRAGTGDFGATPTPQEVTVPDYHFTTLAELGEAVARAH